MEISATLWALWLGKDLCFFLMIAALIDFCFFSWVNLFHIGPELVRIVNNHKHSCESYLLRSLRKLSVVIDTLLLFRWWWWLMMMKIMCSLGSLLLVSVCVCVCLWCNCVSYNKLCKFIKQQALLTDLYFIFDKLLLPSFERFLFIYLFIYWWSTYARFIHTLNHSQ